MCLCMLILITYSSSISACGKIGVTHLCMHTYVLKQVYICIILITYVSMHPLQCVMSMYLCVFLNAYALCCIVLCVRMHYVVCVCMQACIIQGYHLNPHCLTYFCYIWEISSKSRQESGDSMTYSTMDNVVYTYTPIMCAPIVCVCT